MKKKILFALCLIFCFGGGLFYIKNKDGEPADKEAQPVYEILNENTEDKSSAKTEKIYDETGPDKAETVRIKADRYGNKKEVTVETTLKALKEGDTIEDFTTLTDIKNKEGDEEYTLSDDGTIIWQNKGSDIKYRGKTDKELPITVKVTYYLEGKQVTAGEIAGKAGNVKIRFDYQNNTAGYFTEDGVKIRATVPFAAISAVFLDGEKFADVEVENGKAVKADGSIVAMGYALPGLSRGLNLKGYEATKEIDLPEYVEISAYTTDFQIEYTATVFTNGLFEDVKNSDLKDIDDLRSDLDDMQEGVDKMSDAGGKLSEGFGEFKKYLKEYTDNVDLLSKWSGSVVEALSASRGLESGLTDLSRNVTALNGEISALDIPSLDRESQNAVNDISAQLPILKTHIDSLNGKISALTTFKAELENRVNALNGISYDGTKTAIKNAFSAAIGDSVDERTKQRILNAVDYDACLADIKTQIRDLQTQFNDVLQKYPRGIDTDLRNMQNSVDRIKSAYEKLENTDFNTTLAGCKTKTADILAETAAAKAQAEGINAGFAAISQSAPAAKVLSEKLPRASTALTKSADTVESAINEFKNAINEFKEESVKEISKIGRENLTNMKRRIMATRDADKAFKNFGGIAKGKQGSVVFIVETEEVKTQDKN
mgnify:FL=1